MVHLTMEQRVQHQLGMLVHQVLTHQVEKDHLLAQVEALLEQVEVLKAHIETLSAGPLGGGPAVGWSKS
jgi:hypothetical protein